MNSFFSWERVWENLPKLLQALPVTFQIVVVATFFGILLGMVIALVRIKRIPALHQLCGVFISFMRGTPMLVQLLVIYYGLPVLILTVTGLNINRWDRIFFVFVTYSLNQAAFLSEMFRSAILAIEAGQSEAGYSVGLTEAQTFRRIVLPQAARIAIPSFGVDLNGLFQNTSLAYLIGVMDIMGRAKTIGTNTQHTLESYLIIAVIFIIISLVLKGVFFTVNKKLSCGR